jgi:type VI secretion system protein ImpH
LASQTGRPAINIVDDIIENGEEYDFYQAVRLLDRLSDKVASDNQDAQKQLDIRIRPELNLDYPHADIESVEQLGDQSYEIITTFFGLYGVSSPLPGYFTEELLDEEWDERTAARGFLDVIHQHMYPLLYRSWLKYRFAHNAIEADGERYWEIIFSILGLPDEFRDYGDLSGQFVKYAGLLAQRPKTSLGLKTILADYLDPVGVDVVQCIARKVAVIPQQRCRLGCDNHNLGSTCVIGEQVEDRSGKYQVVIGPISTDKFQALLNDYKHKKFMHTMINQYMVQPLECEIVLSLESGAAQPVCLGEPGFSQLGQSAWLVDKNNEFEFKVILN